MIEPTLPRNTCPAIDSVKKRILEAERLARSSQSPEDAEHILGCILNTLSGEADSLEELRDANSKLRECAEYWKKMYEESQ